MSNLFEQRRERMADAYNGKAYSVSKNSSPGSENLQCRQESCPDDSWRPVNDTCATKNGSGYVGVKRLCEELNNLEKKLATALEQRNDPWDELQQEIKEKDAVLESYALTGSARARKVLDEWKEYRR